MAHTSRQQRARTHYEGLDTEALLRRSADAAMRSLDQGLARLTPLVRAGRVRPHHLVAVANLANALNCAVLAAVADLTQEDS